MSIMGSSELGYGQGIDTVIFGMGANELDEGGLPVEIKGDYEPVIPALYLEANPLVVGSLGL
ncbi:protein of unknown function (plasmid) [Shinella sp. WSC3-e]|nr:protein of unknown function [Shinella sp. WSC3-e]